VAETVLSGGRRRAQVDFAKSGYGASVATYRQTVLTAFQEVEDSLSGLGVLAEAAETQQQAVNAAQRALQISNDRYTGGLVTYLDVITAETEFSGRATPGHPDPRPASGDFSELGKSPGRRLGFVQLAGHPRESHRKTSDRTLMSHPAPSALPDHPQGFYVTLPKQGLCTLLLAALLAGTAFWQKPTHPASEEHLALIDRASERERAELENPKLYRYQERLDWSWGSETRSVIETAEGRADQIVLFNGEPLSPEQQARQQRRLEKTVV